MKRTTSLCSTLFTAAFLALCPQLVEAESTHAVRRTLNFPDSASIGTVYRVPQKHLAYDGFSELGPAKQIAPAKGLLTVELLPGEMILLGLNYTFLQHPETLQTLSSTSIDAVKLLFMSVDDDCALWAPALRSISRFKSLREIELNFANLSDRDLLSLKNMTGLERLSLATTLISGVSFRQLVTLTNLRELDLQDVRFASQNYYSDLARFPKLEKLALSRNNIDAACLKAISKCSNLQCLRLNKNPQIDDTCMKYLVPLKHLQYLDLGDTAVTYEGLKLLRGKKLKSLVVDLSELSPRQKKNIIQMFPACENLRAAIASKQDPLKKDVVEIFRPLGKIPK